MDTSNMGGEKVGCGFINTSKTEENGRKNREQEGAARVADSTSESIFNNPGNLMHSTSNPSSKDTQVFSKSSHTYIALIAKVILSSPSQKLNLASIYRDIAEHFPHLISRGPGWSHSVRRNLSVNDCFVKVNNVRTGEATTGESIKLT